MEIIAWVILGFLLGVVLTVAVFRYAAIDPDDLGPTT